MSVTAETVLRRVRGVLGSAGLERLDPGATRLILGKLVFDGHGIPDWHHHAASKPRTRNCSSLIPVTRSESRLPSGFARGAQSVRPAWPTRWPGNNPAAATASRVVCQPRNAANSTAPASQPSAVRPHETPPPRKAR